MPAFVSSPFALVAVAAVFFLWATVVSVILWRLRRRLHAFFRGADGGTLERHIAQHLGQLEQVGEFSRELGLGIEALRDLQRATLQRVGLVRFDAVSQMRGEQSFALALLDAEKSGVILLSLFTREGARLYAKRILRGAAAQALSVEEQRALEAAFGSKP